MFVIFLIAALAHTSAQNQGLTVNTTQGLVQGSSAPDGNYFTFYGVHYGGNTGGPNRFKDPTPPLPYEETYHADDSTVLCAQPSSRGLIGTEDCLTLNIFTNATTPLKPVLVWLVSEEYTKSEQPGGSFKRLVTEGLVVVQINYRLSIFGFLCLGVPEAPGNAGLKDVVQGLKWIKDNIAGFGGDPNNVALFGHGSGAAMADLITMSPAADGLVHKAFVQSGSAVSPWAVAYTPVEYARALGAKLGYTKQSNKALAEHLINTDINLISNALVEFEFYNNTILFAPCVENPELNNTFLTAAPWQILKAGNYSNIPYIAGYTDKEGTIRAEEAAYKQWLEKMQANFTEFLPADLNFGNNLTTVERSIKDFYFGQQPINMGNVEDFLDYEGDTLILVSVIRGARERAAKSRAEVRLMEFAYKGTKNSDWPYNTIPVNGARHGSILNFLQDYDLRPLDSRMSNSLIKRLVNFLTTGSPNVPNSVDWTKVTPEGLNCLRYSGGDEYSSSGYFSELMHTNPHVQRMTFWNDLYFKYYVSPQNVSSSVRVLSVALLLLATQIVLKLF